MSENLSLFTLWGYSVTLGHSKSFPETLNTVNNLKMFLSQSVNFGLFISSAITTKVDSHDNDVMFWKR